jgi:hypothetical protein
MFGFFALNIAYKPAELFLTHTEYVWQVYFFTSKIAQFCWFIIFPLLFQLHSSSTSLSLFKIPPPKKPFLKNLHERKNI